MSKTDKGNIRLGQTVVVESSESEEGGSYQGKGTGFIMKCAIHMNL